MENEKRKDNYRRLREAGFTSKDANMLKNRSEYKIDYLCESMRNFTAWKEKAIEKSSGKGKMKND